MASIPDYLRALLCFVLMLLAYALDAPEGVLAGWLGSVIFIAQARP